ncbi:MAG: 2-aminoethylphosphonate--pyruvate transaminase [bacterium]|nr:2-aminoethylphosphonate--pyruvate transaminase [bacterium]
MTDKYLFTPGPLTTSDTVKRAMLRDLGSRDTEFIAIVKDIRQRLLNLAGMGDFTDACTAILMQGSGTFAIESVISSVMPPDKKLLVIINGAYGRRIAHIAKVHKIPTVELVYKENTLPDLAELGAILYKNTDIAMVACVHCETTTGILNPITEIGKIVKQAEKLYFVDAMSSFGAIAFDWIETGVDYMVSSANKCIEGVPGFGFVIANIPILENSLYARTVSLDLLAQYRGLEADGQFRFTPPTHALLAFHQALVEIEAEGGVQGRGARYAENHRVITEGMAELGFEAYVAPEHQSIIITTYRYPDHPNFDFEKFYTGLNERGFVIYPGKLTDAPCFRIGNIGRLNSDHMRGLLHAIQAVLDDMGVIL